MNDSQSRQETIDNLPVDSDIETGETATGAARPVHVRWRYLGLVAVGGAIGTAIREGFALTFPTTGFPTTVFIINIVGAFVLGFLLESLSRRGPDEGRRRTIRLFGGTGVLGGFTTYSSLATSSAQLLESQWTIGVVYALASVIIGYGASWLGITLGATLHRANTKRQGTSS